MTAFFLACAALGALILIVQIVGGLAGADGAHLHGDVSFEEGLELFSVRSLAAGVAGYGIGGLALLELGFGAGLAAALAVIPASLALAATAAAMRQMLRLESDGSLRLEGALGEPATVYLTVPPAGGGPGKVQIALQGRTVELLAVSRESRPLPTGTPVVVVAVEGDTVEVLPTTTVGEILQ